MVYTYLPFFNCGSLSLQEPVGSLGPLESASTGGSWKPGFAGVCQEPGVKDTTLGHGTHLGPQWWPGATGVSIHQGEMGTWDPGSLQEAYINSLTVKKNKHVNHAKKFPDSKDIHVSVVIHSLAKPEWKPPATFPAHPIGRHWSNTAKELV